MPDSKPSDTPPHDPSSLDNKHLLVGERVQPVSFPEIRNRPAVGGGVVHNVWDITPEKLRQMRLPTAEEILKIQESARQEGHREGYQAGYREGQAAGEKAGYASGAQKIQQEVQRLQGVFQQLSQPLAHVETQISVLMVAVLTTALEVLLKHALSSERHDIRAIVDEALSNVKDAPGVVRVKLNPADLALYQNAYQGAQPEGTSAAPVLGDTIQWVTDAAIRVGGCLVETSACEVDARLETRLEHVLTHLKAVADEARPSDPITDPIDDASQETVS